MSGKFSLRCPLILGAVCRRAASTTAAAGTAPKVASEVRGPVAIVTLVNPSRRNPLSLETLRQLEAALDRHSADNTVRAVLLRGVGAVFSAGHDLKELRSRADTRQAVMAQCTKVMLKLHEMPLPVVAQVSGLATAAGCQLVASCDLAVAGLSARFATPGVKVGLFCSTPAVALGRAVSAKTAMRMLLTGEPITAEEALAAGLVSHLAPDGEQLDSVAEEVASSVAKHSRAVVALGKRAFYKQIQLPRSQAYQLAEHAMLANLRLPDAKEGISAFLEKRHPQWSHSIVEEKDENK